MDKVYSKFGRTAKELIDKTGQVSDIELGFCSHPVYNSKNKTLKTLNGVMISKMNAKPNFGEYIPYAKLTTKNKLHSKDIASLKKDIQNNCHLTEESGGYLLYSAEICEKDAKPKDEYITPIDPIIELEFAYISSPAQAIKYPPEAATSSANTITLILFFFACDLINL